MNQTVKIILGKLVDVVPLLFLMSLISFFLTALIPGDPARAALGEYATAEQVQALRQQMGLDQPVVVRYLHWVANAARGEFGLSIVNGQPVGGAIAQALPVTASLVVAAILIQLCLALPIGMIAGYRPDSRFSRWCERLAMSVISVPDYWLGLLAILFFALTLGLLPSYGFVDPGRDFRGWLSHIIMPAVTLSITETAVLFRFVRASVSDTRTRDFVRTMRAGGVSPARILFKHVGKNAMTPVVTVFGLQVASIVGGAAVVESIFGLSGIGRLVVTSALGGDTPVIQAVVLLTGVSVIAINLLVELAYLYLNPKLRTG